VVNFQAEKWSVFKRKKHMGTLPDAAGDSSLTFEIQKRKRAVQFKENQLMGCLLLKIDILC